MSMFEIFAIIQDWYSGYHGLASACLAAHTQMPLCEAYEYLEEHGEEGMTVLFTRIVEVDESSEYQAILDNLSEMKNYLNNVIKNVQELIDVRLVLEKANG